MLNALKFNVVDVVMFPLSSRNLQFRHVQRRSRPGS